jgi:hypothetical protein
MLALCLAVCVSAPKLWAQESKGTLIEFDAPNAGTVNSPECAPYCGTFAYANNDLGVIVGSYSDTNIVPHGFLRAPNGQITSFDAPGAGLGYGLDQGTVASSINDLGAVTGQFQDPSYVFHGFVRFPNGSFTTFEEPDAGTEAGQGTFPSDINLLGTIAGIYYDQSNAIHSFVRSPSNQFTSFAPTGSVNTQVCSSTCLNLNGTVTGFYADSSGVAHGFVREANGTITSFDAPAPATLTTIVTQPKSINPSGVIAGFFVDSAFGLHGFLRDPDGSFTTLDDPDGGAGAFQGTIPLSINLEGATTGQFIDATNNVHGFERFPDGQFATFDAPGAASGPDGGLLAGTRPSTNNAEGEVAGWYVDAGGLNHGFLWIP